MLKIVFGKEVTTKANIHAKDGYTFISWDYQGKSIFDKEGKITDDVWNADFGDDGTHICLDPSFKENKKQPQPQPEKTQPASNNNVEPPAEQKDKVKTGDENNITLFLVLMAVFTATGAFVIVKKKEEE